MLPSHLLPESSTRSTHTVYYTHASESSGTHTNLPILLRVVLTTQKKNKCLKLREFCVVLFGQICVRFRQLMVFVPHVYESNVRSFCKASFVHP